MIAVDGVDASLKIAELLRSMFPHLEIFARAHNRHHELQLRELGIKYVMRDTLMSSLELTVELLQRLGSTNEAARAAVEMFRQHDAQVLARQAAVYKDEKAFRQTTIDAAQELRELFTEDSVSVERGPHRRD